MKKFIKCGEIHDGYMIVQVAAGVGMWICPIEGNRKSDEFFDLDYSPVSMRYGKYVDELCEDSENKVSPQGSCKHKADKPSTVELVRYIRPHTVYGAVDNMRGVTLVIQLDYTQKDILFQYSICDGDNFDKSVGVDLAYKRLLSIGAYSLPMIDGKVSNNGVVHDIVTTIRKSIATDQCTIPKHDAIKIVSSYYSSFG